MREGWEDGGEGGGGERGRANDCEEFGEERGENGGMKMRMEEG